MSRNVKLASRPICQYQHQTLFCRCSVSCWTTLPCTLVVLLLCLSVVRSLPAALLFKPSYPFPVLVPFIFVLAVSWNRRCDLISLVVPLPAISHNISIIFLGITLHSSPPPFTSQSIFFTFMLAALSCSYLSPATEEELTDSVSTNDGTTPVHLLLQPRKSANMFSTTFWDSVGKTMSSTLLTFFQNIYIITCVPR